MEKFTSDLNNRVFDWQKTFTTIVFVALSAMLTVYGVMSRLEVRDLTAKVDKSIEEMKRSFDDLSRGIVRKPQLEIVYKNKPLNGQIVPSGTSLAPLFVRNSGSKSTEPISVRFYCSESVTVNGGWQRTASNEPEFPLSYYCYFGGLLPTVGAGETWSIEDAISVSLSDASKTNVPCKLVVYYGGDKPAEAAFNIVPSDPAIKQVTP